MLQEACRAGVEWSGVEAADASAGVGACPSSFTLSPTIRSYSLRGLIEHSATIERCPPHYVEFDNHLLVVLVASDKYVGHFHNSTSFREHRTNEVLDEEIDRGHVPSLTKIRSWRTELLQ